MQQNLKNNGIKKPGNFKRMMRYTTSYWQFKAVMALIVASSPERCAAQASWTMSSTVATSNANAGISPASRAAALSRLAVANRASLPAPSPDALPP